MTFRRTVPLIPGLIIGNIEERRVMASVLKFASVKNA
jgi:hypothetical protein